MITYKTKKSMGLVVMLALSLVVVLAASLLVAGCGDEDTATDDATDVSTDVSTDEGTDAGADLAAADLVGAGASFPNPVYVDWIGGFQGVFPQITVDYTAVGSGAGIEQFTAQTTDFGGTDAFMDEEEIAAAEAANVLGGKVMQIPTVFGAVVLAYNLEGVDEFVLDSDAIADIFLGNITMWNDQALADLNPGVELPDANIEVVHRSDSSGTTNAFTGYLTSVNTDWADQVGTGKEVDWPTGIGGQKNDGVAAAITNTPNSIGYVELAYATLNNMTMAAVKNASGNFITPSLESTSLAANLDVVPDDLYLEVANSSVAEAYPIVSGTYIMVYDKMGDADKAAALRAFLTWALSDAGDEFAEALGYATLPTEVETKALEKIALIGE